MPLRDPSGIGTRVPRELIEGDFSIAFSLVEMAGTESSRNNGQIASQLLQRAGGMLEDIRARLQRMSAAQREEFEPRCEELAAAIERAGQAS